MKDEASVFVAIFTDKYENAFSDFSLEQVGSLIWELELTDKWSFSYICATLDVVDTAIKMNIRVPNAIDLSVQESGREYNRVSDSMNDYMMEKRSGRIKKDFLDKD